MAHWGGSLGEMRDGSFQSQLASMHANSYIWYGIIVHEDPPPHHHRIIRYLKLGLMNGHDSCWHKVRTVR